MTQQRLYDLQVDFVNQHGHFMVLSSPEGLKQEELSEFQLNMLSANRIPNLLELQLEAREGHIQLYYHITGKRMLAYWLRLEKLTLRRFYTLLHRIVEVLDDSKIYMLQPGRYILKEEYIYCGNGLEDVYLTYVPTLHLEGKAPITSDLQQLVSRWIQRVTELHGSGYQELMGYLIEENFNIPELKQLLLKHIRESTAERAHIDKVDRSAIDKELVEASVMSPLPPKHSHSSDESGIADYLRMEAGFSVSSDASVSAGSLSNSMIAEEERPDRDVRRKQVIIVLLSVLILCFVWKLYAESSEEWMLYGCAAVTVLVSLTAGVLINKTRAKPYPDNEVAQGTIADDAETFLANTHNGLADDAFLGRIGLGDCLPVEQPAQRSAEDMRTTLLKPADATVFLGRSGTQTKGSASNPYFETIRNGRKEKVVLNKNSFVIGRKGDGVDWVQEEVGVSRLHAEIVKEGGDFVVKDLGSRNGTAVNGEMLTPYRLHPLVEGDIVTIVTTEYTFKVGT